MYIVRGWLVLICCSFFIISLQAQESDSIPNDELNQPLGDTNQVYYYYEDNPELLYPIDTSLGIEYINPVWGDWAGYQDLGLVGTPHFMTTFRPLLRGGVRTGLEHWEAYRLTEQQLKYYKVTNNIPITDLYYSQLSQRNTYIRATFAHQVVPNFYYHINYNLINYTGFFDHQRTRNQNINLTTKYRTLNGKYGFQLDVFHNAAKVEQNGGVVDAGDVANTGAAFLSSISVQNTEALNQNYWTKIGFRQNWYNARAADSTTEAKDASIVLEHRMSWSADRFKYFDENPDSAYYGTYWTNARAIRHFVQLSYLENEFSYRQAIGGSLINAPLAFKLYGRHRWNIINLEPERFQRHQVTAGAQLRSNPKLAFNYNARGEATWILGDVLDFWLKGELGYDLQKVGKVRAFGLFERYSVGLVAEQLYLSRAAVWNYDARQVQVFSFGGAYTYDAPKWLEAEVGAESHTLTNWLYYDTLGMPQQLNTTISLLQAKGMLNFHFGAFHVENQATFQSVLGESQALPLPQLQLLHKIYWEGRIFKTMKLRLGANMRYWSDYSGYAFMPHTGQFHIHNEGNLNFYPIFDVYVVAKVWRFRFFANAENVSQLVTGNNYFTVLNHPSPNFFVRIGIGWRIFD